MIHVAVNVLGAFAMLLVAADAATPLVAVDVAGCGFQGASEVPRLLSLELGVPLAAAAQPNMTAVILQCEGAEHEPSLLHIEVDDKLTAKHSTRDVEITPMSSFVRARFIALTVAEMIRWSWSEIEAQESLRSEVLKPIGLREAQDPLARRAAQRASLPRRPWRFETGLELRHSHGGVATWGGQLAVSRAFAGHPALALVADVGAGLGDTLTPEGNIASFVGTAAFGLRASHTVGSLMGDMTAGGRMGLLRLSGRPRDGSASDLRGLTAMGPWAGPCAGFGVSTSVGSRGRLRLALEAGYAAWGYAGLSSRGTATASMTGAWAGVQLSWGFAL